MTSHSQWLLQPLGHLLTGTRQALSPHTLITSSPYHLQNSTLLMSLTWTNDTSSATPLNRVGPKGTATISSRLSAANSASSWHLYTFSVAGWWCCCWCCWWCTRRPKGVGWWWCWWWCLCLVCWPCRDLDGSPGCCGGGRCGASADPAPTPSGIPTTSMPLGPSGPCAKSMPGWRGLGGCCWCCWCWCLLLSLGGAGGGTQSLTSRAASQTSAVHHTWPAAASILMREARLSTRPR